MVNKRDVLTIFLKRINNSLGRESLVSENPEFVLGIFLQGGFNAERVSCLLLEKLHVDPVKSTLILADLQLCMNLLDD